MGGWVVVVLRVVYLYIFLFVLVLEIGVFDVQGIRVEYWIQVQFFLLFVVMQGQYCWFLDDEDGNDVQLGYQVDVDVVQCLGQGGIVECVEYYYVDDVQVQQQYGQWLFFVVVYIVEVGFGYVVVCYDGGEGEEEDGY